MTTVICILLLTSFLMILYFPWFLYRFTFPRKKKSDLKIIAPRHVDILIPCHNEEGRLEATLSSLTLAMETCRKFIPNLSVSVRVGLDSCTDRSAMVAEAGKAMVEKYNFRSKWETIQALIQSSTADWVILVDCGIIWQKNFLRNAYPFLCCPQVAGVAPTYRTRRNSLFDKIHWKIESTFKRMENNCGGPISVHGATILYRLAPLRRCLHVLGGRRWLNDDVVIPLILRALYPEYKIIYATNLASGFFMTDTSLPAQQQAVRARKRMALGNLQWILHLSNLVSCWDRRVMFLASRRAMRTYWGLIPVLTSLLFCLVLIEFLPLESFILLPLALTFFSVCIFLLLQSPALRASLHAVSLTLRRQNVEWEDIPWN